jgi:methylmalonyl-CoA mutase N-terminal domain/subunit
MDPNVERIAVERLTKFKEKRDNNKTKAALENMKDVAEKMKDGWPNGPDLMPAAIEAADANATIGEMTDIIKAVFGWGYTYGL